MENFKLKIVALIIFTCVFILNVGNVTARRNINLRKADFEFYQLKGKPAPGFTLKDTAGNKISLADLKGKVIYMDIWASWCAPCLLQIKKSESLKKQFENNNDVIFLYVSIDKNEGKWKSTISKRKINGLHLISAEGKEENIIQNYQVPSIPRFILIDKNGNIADFNAKAPSSSGIAEDIQKLL